MESRLVPAPISLVFSVASLNYEEFEREFHKLSEFEDNAIHQWLKLAKARGETSDTDPVLLNLVVELHNKIDALEMLIKNEKPKRVALTTEAHIESIGFEHFKIKEKLLDVGENYYARVEMPVHPKRDVGIFFKAESASLAKIIRIQERDEKEWNAYMTARERVLIREAKEAKGKR